MNVPRLRRLERVARAWRRAAEVELAAAGRRLDRCVGEERSARERHAEAAGRRGAALAAGVEARRARILQASLEAWGQAVAAARASRREAEAGYEAARRTLVEAYQNQRALEFLVRDACDREAAARAHREAVVADEHALVRFALQRERR